MLGGERFLGKDSLKSGVVMGVPSVCQTRLNQGFKLGFTP